MAAVLMGCAVIKPAPKPAITKADINPPPCPECPTNNPPWTTEQAPLPPGSLQLWIVGYCVNTNNHSVVTLVATNLAYAHLYQLERAQDAAGFGSPVYGANFYGTNGAYVQDWEIGPAGGPNQVFRLHDRGTNF